MSLNWQWTDKMGTCTFADGSQCNIYRGNAFMIAIYETDKTYSLVWFAADKNHMKNLLGLNKDFNNCFEDWKITEMSLDTKYKETKEFLQMACAAKLKITINLY